MTSIKDIISQMIISGMTDEDITNTIKTYEDHYQRHVEEALVELDPEKSQSISFCMSGIVEARRLLLVEQNNRANETPLSAATREQDATGALFDAIFGTDEDETDSDPIEDQVDDLFTAFFGGPKAKAEPKPETTAPKSPLDGLFDALFEGTAGKPEKAEPEIPEELAKLFKFLGL